MRANSSLVAGLVPAIHVFAFARIALEAVDARDKPGQGDFGEAQAVQICLGWQLSN
jgi:hypothetical protein